MAHLAEANPSFTPVDPFEPSVAFSIKKLWSSKPENEENIETRPPRRHKPQNYPSYRLGVQPSQSRPVQRFPSQPQQTIIQQPPPAPYVDHTRYSRERSHTPQYARPPITVVPNRHISRSRSRARMHSRSPSIHRTPPPLVSVEEELYKLQGRSNRPMYGQPQPPIIIHQPPAQSAPYGDRTGYSRERSHTPQQAQPPIVVVRGRSYSRSRSRSRRSPSMHRTSPPLSSRSRSPRAARDPSLPPSVIIIPSDPELYGPAVPRRSPSPSRQHHNHRPQIDISVGRSRSRSRSIFSSTSRSRRPNSRRRRNNYSRPESEPSVQYSLPSALSLSASRPRSSLARSCYREHVVDVIERPPSNTQNSLRQSARPNYPPSPPLKETEKYDQQLPDNYGTSITSATFTAKDYALAFVVDTLPRQIYLHLLLRLPYLYFSRVTRIFEEAELTMPQIKQGILEAATQMKADSLDATWFESPNVPYGNLEKTWSHFIDSLMREWKTLNIISVLLLSAILTILQIDSAANDPVTRFSALLSMICALMSLLYGCIYIIRFGTMRKTYKAAEWAHESQQTRTGVFWNVWVLLAMPATWLAWSMILYIICIISFVWRTGTVNDDRGPMTQSEALAPRIVVTCVLSVGIIYFVLIASTLRRYGDIMDRAWQRRIMGWMSDGIAELYTSVHTPPNNGSYQQMFAMQSPDHDSYQRQPPIIVPTPSSRRSSCGREPYEMRKQATNATPVNNLAPTQSSSDLSRGRPMETKKTMAQTASVRSTENGSANRDIKMTRLLHFSGDDFPVKAMPPEKDLIRCNLSKEKWVELSDELGAVWDCSKLESTLPVVSRWNDSLFYKHGGQIALCDEFGGPPWMNQAIYHFSSRGRLPSDQSRYESISIGLQRLDIIPKLTIDVDKIPEPISLFTSRKHGVSCMHGSTYQSMPTSSALFHPDIPDPALPTEQHDS